MPKIPEHYLIPDRNLVVTHEELCGDNDTLERWARLALAINHLGRRNYVLIYNPTGLGPCDRGKEKSWWSNLPPNFYMVGMPTFRDREESQERCRSRGDRSSAFYLGKDHGKFSAHQKMQDWGPRVLGDRFYQLQPGDKKEVLAQVQALLDEIETRSAGAPFTVIIAGTHATGKTTLILNLLASATWEYYDPTRILRSDLAETAPVTDVERARKANKNAFYWVRLWGPDRLKYGMHKDPKTLNKYLQDKYGTGSAKWELLAWDTGGANMEAVAGRYAGRFASRTDRGKEYYHLTSELVGWIIETFSSQNNELLNQAWYDAQNINSGGEKQH